MFCKCVVWFCCQVLEILYLDDKDCVCVIVGLGDCFFILIEEELDVWFSVLGVGQIVISGDIVEVCDEVKCVLWCFYVSLEYGLICDEVVVCVVLCMCDDEESGVEDDGVICVLCGFSLIVCIEGQCIYVCVFKNEKVYDLIFGVGFVGIGKMLLVVVYGVLLLVQCKVEKLIIMCLAVEVGEKLGFLLGDLIEKVDFYLLLVWDVLVDMLGCSQLEKMCEDGCIEVVLIVFMCG